MLQLKLSKQLPHSGYSFAFIPFQGSRKPQEAIFVLGGMENTSFRVLRLCKPLLKREGHRFSRLPIHLDLSLSSEPSKSDK